MAEIQNKCILCTGRNWLTFLYKCELNIPLNFVQSFYDSLSCLTSVDCHVKGLILASQRQTNIPLARSFPE
ncbi:DNA-directed RNA polymerase, mitochondrial, partial [Clarias magur]